LKNKKRVVIEKLARANRTPFGTYRYIALFRGGGNTLAYKRRGENESRKSTGVSKVTNNGDGSRHFRSGAATSTFYLERNFLPSANRRDEGGAV